MVVKEKFFKHIKTCLDKTYVVWATKKNKNKMAFEKWLESVNALLFGNYGVLIADLPDEPFRNYFEDKLSPKNVVDIMVTNNLELL